MIQMKMTEQHELSKKAFSLYYRLFFYLKKFIKKNHTIYRWSYERRKTMKKGKKIIFLIASALVLSNIPYYSRWNTDNC